jgi:cell division protein FtsL
VSSLSSSSDASRGPIENAAAAKKRHGEKGAARAKAIIWTCIFLSMIYVGIKVMPVLVTEYQFQDSIQEIARFASATRKNNEQIKQAVLDEAQKEDLPVTGDDIKVEGSAGNVRINVEYSVIVDLKVYQWTLLFHPATSNNAVY